MNGRFLLDTSTIISLFRGDPEVLLKLSQARAAFVPTIALGELYYGAHKSARVSSNLERIEQFALASDVLVCDGSTAKHYGAIKNRLRELGRPIPENDIWIAALARQHGLTVATRDQHFGAIEALDVEAW